MIDRVKLAAELDAQLDEGTTPRELVDTVTRHAQAAADEKGRGDDPGYVVALDYAELLMGLAAKPPQ